MGEEHPIAGSLPGVCDYCGKHRLVAKLDDRAYLACAVCATEIHCYQAVTDVEAVAPEAPPVRKRRTPRDAGEVAAKRRLWLNRLGRALERNGAEPLAVVEITGVGKGPAAGRLEAVFPAADGGKDLDRAGLGA